MRRARLGFSVFGLLVSGACAGSLWAETSAPKPLDVSLASKGGIGFDDLIFAPKLRRVIAPGGRTGSLYLIDPDSRQVTTIPGFKVTPGVYQSGHEDGPTSVDEAGDLLLATDRSTRTLSVVDPQQGRLVSSVALASGPDYVRWVSATHEAWVTGPDREQIEVFSVGTGVQHALARVGTIAVKGGPESLLIDERRGRAFTHLWHGSTLAFDLRTRARAATWPNDCQGSRGLALDSERGWLFAGCAEGKATTLDVDHDGKQLGSASTGAGVDIIAYSPKLRHLYVPAAKSATLSVLSVSSTGALATLAT
ncbi:MAG TPA: hypothetical protein VGM29_12895 [Polyangiaceae bacterium]|jgi:hypothetical protein